MFNSILGEPTQTRFTIGSTLWMSVKNRISRDIKYNDGVDYILLKFVCDDVMNKTNIIITKEMLEEQRNVFLKLLEESKNANVKR